MIDEPFLEELVRYTGFLVGVAESGGSIPETGKLCNEISAHYRALGICWLLRYADVETFGQGLAQSAVTRRYFLDQCRQAGALEIPARKASFIDPFLDAVAVNQPDLARDIVRLSPSDWMTDYEYEDDFAYAQFLFHALDGEKADRSRLEQILARHERSLEGNPDLRFDICGALFHRNQAAFSEAFESLVDETEERNAEIGHPDSDSILQQNYTFKPNRYLFVEGLALLRYAGWFGLDAGSDYRFCPAIARVDDFGSYVPDSFPYLPI